MKDRLIGGAIFVIIIASVLFLRELSLMYFDLLVLILTGFGAFEMSRAFRGSLVTSNHIATAIYVASIIPVYYLFDGMMSVCTLFVVYFWATAIISFSSHENGKGFQNIASAVLIGVYPILMFSFLIDINHWAQDSTLALILIFTVGPFCDVAAFMFGKLIGGKKLLPEISPKKTVSGAIGGIAGGITASVLVFFLVNEWNVISVTNEFSIWFYITFGVIGAIITELGDLVESSIKRSLTIKDMGDLIPGHGGVLDRFDGVMFVVFITYVYFHLVYAIF